MPFWWEQQATRERIPDLSAVIFDVDGTLADTERDGHRPAFNEAFAIHGIDISWDAAEYGRLLKIAGGRRRIAADLARRGFGDNADKLAADIHRTKTELFRERVAAGDLTPRPGLLGLVMSLADEGIRIAVATTGRRAWVEPLVTRLLGTGIVETIVTGDDVTRLKPDPEVYVQALERLNLSPQNTLAVEDSELGLQAATGAGIATVVVRTDYTAGQDFTGAAMVRAGFDGIDALRAPTIRRVHRQWWGVGKAAAADRREGGRP
jgi:HAD superfamily hydrolase (TIGR01509 family)